MSFDATVELGDGTRHPLEVPLTAGMVRQYMADPNPCQCEECQQTFPLAARLLGLLEDHLANRITEKQFKRGLKLLGFHREGKIEHH
jgi:hypothetical protein